MIEIDIIYTMDAKEIVMLTNRSINRLIQCPIKVF